MANLGNDMESNIYLLPILKRRLYDPLEYPEDPVDPLVPLICKGYQLVRWLGGGKLGMKSSDVDAVCRATMELDIRRLFLQWDVYQQSRLREEQLSRYLRDGIITIPFYFRLMGRERTQCYRNWLRILQHMKLFVPYIQSPYILRPCARTSYERWRSDMMELRRLKDRLHEEFERWLARRNLAIGSTHLRQWVEAKRGDDRPPVILPEYIRDILDSIRTTLIPSRRCSAEGTGGW
ncbi:hypothetical protein FKW77_000859 [Venturia effusa]|uniref:Uncharacterized protein n=1 Tax=Venturia effusa TaxID=50376 RepID=A0A517LAB0_9PEZI|nr:hypothetical protein FKW77_000859 [Venturia effusa]